MITTTKSHLVPLCLKIWISKTHGEIYIKGLIALQGGMCMSVEHYKPSSGFPRHYPVQWWNIKNCHSVLFHCLHVCPCLFHMPSFFHLVIPSCDFNMICGRPWVSEHSQRTCERSHTSSREELIKWNTSIVIHGAIREQRTALSAIS